MAGGMLEGVRVLDLTTVVIGPLCTQILADHGAEVIKVESPDGDIGRTLGGRGRHPGMAPKFLHLNRNKRSVCLDLKQPAARAAVLRLAAACDVLTWNVRPASMQRLGLGWDDLRRVNPRLVYCGMYGFGERGRYAGTAAYDPIIQGVSGVAGLHAQAFGTPRYVPYVMADRTAGLIAVQMIAMALFHRERTGEGQCIEVPMFENLATQVLTEHLYGRTYAPPIGPAGDPRLLNAHYTPSRTADGWISMSANTDAQVFALFDAMGEPQLKDDPRFGSVAARFANVDAYFELRAQGIARFTTAYWLDTCRQRDIPAAPYHTLDSLIDDPHLADVGLLVQRHHPTEGDIVDLVPANTVSAGHRTDWRPAPRLGEHTTEVLREAGFADDELATLLAAGAACQAPPPEA